MSVMTSEGSTTMVRLWQIVTLRMLCWKARVILVLLAVGAILDWMR